MNSLKLKSPAKINLNLQILNKREDAYHNLKSEFCTINLFDKIRLTKIPAGIQLITNGKYKIPNNRDNLVYQIAEQLRVKAKGKVGVKIEIDKQIPLFAGLGGGSSNVATVLQGLNELWNLHLDPEKKIEIGAKIGADVPFFLHGGFCLVEGIGEKVTPLEKEIETKHVIVAQLPYIKISTPWAYRQFDKLELKIKDEKFKISPVIQPCLHFRGTGSEKVASTPFFKEKQITSTNDFEKVIFPHFPDLAELKAIFSENGAIQSNMTGSGSAVYGLFEEKEIAEKCLEKIKDKCEFVWLGELMNESTCSCVLFDYV